jgi:hypothetical protein
VIPTGFSLAHVTHKDSPQHNNNNSLPPFIVGQRREVFATMQSEMEVRGANARQSESERLGTNHHAV